MSALRSNLEHWKNLQDRDYFEHHPCYKGLKDDFPFDDAAHIELFRPLRPDMNVAVIGCGYGRDVVNIAPKVAKVYGIDVNERVLAKARGFLGARGVTNFVPVLADRYAAEMPDGIDLVYSIVVAQHLTRDLVAHYLHTLRAKMREGGTFLIQFLEDLNEGAEQDAALRDYEPSVSWTTRQILDLCRRSELTFREVRSSLATPTAIWHWAYFGVGDATGQPAR